MAYVRNCWYVAAWESDLTPGQPISMTILQEPLVMWSTGKGDVTVLEDRCVHRLAPLSSGRCEGDKLRCMYHGLLFDREGRVTEIPGQDVIPPQARVRRFPAVIRHSWVWVWMGDPKLADEALIPPAVGFDDPDYILGNGHMDYEAEARLICDNLLDFSHLTYVHAASFQAGPAFAAELPRITPLERGIRFERWVENSKEIRGDNRGNERSALCDRWSTYDFLVPGILLMTGGNYPVGSAAACGFGPPDLAKATSGVTFTSQAVTPMNAMTSRYFFSWGPRKDCGDAAMRDGLVKLAVQAFTEDKLMIEAQQRIINNDAARNIMPTVHDRGVTIYNNLVKKMASA